MPGQGSGDPWVGIHPKGKWLEEKKGINFDFLVSEIEGMTAVVNSKIETMRAKKDEMSIAAMFDMQYAMNKLSQVSEYSSAVVSAMNTAMIGVAKNIR